jgi:N-acylglucosamine-6-phosphate 2-epimerase
MFDNSIGKRKLLESLKGGLIVSCQAREGWPMYGKEIMAAFAKAAEDGGAVGIRANKPESISEICKKVNLPVIGINKIWNKDYEVYITPTYQSAVEIIEAGSSIIALDCTKRPRPNRETFGQIIERLREKYPDILIMADISTLEEGIEASKKGVDLVSTTLSGYTEYTKHITGTDFKLIERLKEAIDTPVIAEGKIHSPEDAKRAIELGAYAVVVGTAITRPEIITKWYSDKLKEISQG